MKNTNPVFSLKNFRSFGEDGADFELAPITVLTGCNSAGKSSLTKALLLLSKEEHDIIPISSPVLALGRFDKVLNENSRNGIFKMSYRIWSVYLQEFVDVTHSFKALENDPLNNGELIEFTISKTDGTILVSDNQGRVYHGDLHTHVDHFLAAVEYDNIQIEDPEMKLVENKRKANELKGRLGNLTPEDYGDTILEWQQENKRRQKKDKKSLEFYFANHVTSELSHPPFLKNVAYSDSSSVIVKRLYSIEEDNKMCNALRRMQEDNRPSYLRYSSNFKYEGSFLNNWIKKFGIGDKIVVEGTEEGLGMMVYLVRNEKKRLLADEGYGITQLVSLLLTIDSSIRDKCPYLPYDSDEFAYETNTICIEEPENHLHPKYQSLLADMFVEAYQKYNIHFIIETHSEYLIRKLQVMVADKENKLSSNDVSLNYVEKNENGVSHNRQIKILEDGRLDGSFGEGFYDEAGGLSRQLFMLNE